MTMDDTRVIHLKLNFVQTELPQTSSPSPFSPWPTRAKILAEFCRVFSSKTQVYCICTRRTTTTAYSTDISSATVGSTFFLGPFSSLYIGIALQGKMPKPDFEQEAPPLEYLIVGPRNRPKPGVLERESSGFPSARSFSK